MIIKSLYFCSLPFILPPSLFLSFYLLLSVCLSVSLPCFLACSFLFSFLSILLDKRYSRVPKNGVTAVEFYASADENEHPGAGSRRSSESSDPDVTSAPIDEILTKETLKSPEKDRAFIIGARYNK